MWLDLLALAVVAFLTFTGSRRGALVSFLRIFSMLGAYVGAFYLGPLVAPLIVLVFGAPQLFAVGAGGAAVFLMIFLGLGGVTAWVMRARKRKGAAQEPIDRVAGALLGAAHGVLLAMLIGVLAGWLAAGRKSGPLQSMPDLGGRAVSTVTRLAVEGVADVVLDAENAGGRVAVRLAVRPDETITDVQDVVQHPAVRGLQSDPQFWSHVQNGAIEQALSAPSFATLERDDSLRRRLADLGLVSPSAATDERRFRSEMRPVLVRLTPRLRVLHNDPTLRELSRDPRIVAAVESGDTFTLLSDPRVNALVQRLLDADSVPAARASEP